MLNGPETGRVCRLCLCRQASHGIFLGSPLLVDKIHSCCSLQIYENDGLPDHICEDCLSTLDVVANFRNQCEESDKILRDGLFDVKPVIAEIPIVKEEYHSDHNDSQYIDYNSPDIDDVKPDDEIFEPPKKKAKKLSKRTEKPPSEHDYIKLIKKEEHPGEQSSKKGRKRKLTDGNQSGLCPFCGKVFFKMSSLNVHLRLHTMEKTHTCTKCSKSFRELRMLRDHEKTHLNIKNFPCEVCGKLFGSRGSAKKHLEAVHRKSKVVFCSLCNKKLASNRSLKGHMKTHTGEKEFECDICEQSFAFKCSLVVHLRCHTGEKPYSCKYCGARFAALKTIKEHERLHTGETPYVCPVCSRGFSQKSNMKSHFRNNHKGVELP